MKFHLYLITHDATIKYRRVKVQLHAFFTSATGRLHVPTHYPQGKIPYSKYVWEAGEEGRIDSVARRKWLLSTGVKPRLLSKPQSSYYTDKCPGCNSEFYEVKGTYLSLVTKADVSKKQGTATESKSKSLFAYKGRCQ
jgi:hypothetical protein